MLSQTPAINDRQRSAEVPQHPQFAVPAVPPTCSASFTPFRRTSSSQHRFENRTPPVPRQDPVCQGKARLAARAVCGLAALAIMVLGELREARILCGQYRVKQRARIERKHFDPYGFTGGVRRTALRTGPSRTPLTTPALLPSLPCSGLRRFELGPIPGPLPPVLGLLPGRAPAAP
jgi:hypothetical protein